MQAASLVLAVTGRRSGRLTGKIGAVVNARLTDLAEIGDSRTEAGDQAGLTTWVGRVPIGDTAIPQSPVSQGLTSRVSGLHLIITNS